MFETLVVITKVVSGGVERQGGMTEAGRERGRERERQRETDREKERERRRERERDAVSQR